MLQVPPPKTAKQLKLFLGLANHFRDHIAHYADIVRPLQELLRAMSQPEYSTEYPERQRILSDATSSQQIARVVIFARRLRCTSHKTDS